MEGLGQGKKEVKGVENEMLKQISLSVLKQKICIPRISFPGFIIN